eukprot:1538795-Alexandrium_andersonii.AAC.1
MPPLLLLWCGWKGTKRILGSSRAPTPEHGGVRPPTAPLTSGDRCADTLWRPLGGSEGSSGEPETC